MLVPDVYFSRPVWCSGLPERVLLHYTERAMQLYSSLLRACTDCCRHVLTFAFRCSKVLGCRCCFQRFPRAVFVPTCYTSIDDVAKIPSNPPRFRFVRMIGANKRSFFPRRLTARRFAGSLRMSVRRRRQEAVAARGMRLILIDHGGELSVCASTVVCNGVIC